jgi:hypothetical protein
MNKIVITTMMSLGFLIPSLCMAEVCQGSYYGKDFYAAYTSDTNGASCEYRYCYYGCIYESYTLPGHYRPSESSMPYWEKSDTGTGYTCYARSSSCEFVAK